MCSPSYMGMPATCPYAAMRQGCPMTYNYGANTYASNTYTPYNYYRNDNLFIEMNYGIAPMRYVSIEDILD